MPCSSVRRPRRVNNAGKEATAENLETQAQLDFLRSHDCDIAQGYYLSSIRWFVRDGFHRPKSSSRASLGPLIRDARRHAMRMSVQR